MKVNIVILFLFISFSSSSQTVYSQFTDYYHYEEINNINVDSSLIKKNNIKQRKTYELQIHRKNNRKEIDTLISETVYFNKLGQTEELTSFFFRGKYETVKFSYNSTGKVTSYRVLDNDSLIASCEFFYINSNVNFLVFKKGISVEQMRFKYDKYRNLFQTINRYNLRDSICREYKLTYDSTGSLNKSLSYYHNELKSTTLYESGLEKSVIKYYRNSISDSTYFYYSPQRKVEKEIVVENIDNRINWITDNTYIYKVTSGLLLRKYEIHRGFLKKFDYKYDKGMILSEEEYTDGILAGGTLYVYTHF